MTPMTVHFVLR